MSFQYDEMYAFAEWSFDNNISSTHHPHYQPATPTIVDDDGDDNDNDSLLITHKIHKKFEHPPRWDSFRNRIMTDEQAAQKVRDDIAAANAAAATATATAKQRKKLSYRWTTNPPRFSSSSSTPVRSSNLSPTTTDSSPLLTLITPIPTDTILHIACSTGHLTTHLAHKVPQGTVIGLDSSSTLIDHASTTHTSPFNNLVFLQHSPSQLSSRPEDLVKWDGAWDWVVSKDEFHKTLKAREMRTGLWEDVHRLLKPGGKLVFECGGAGNVPELVTAWTAAMAVYGVESEARRDVNPWFCASEEWMREALEGAGFEVLECRAHYEPVKVTMHDGSLEGWVREVGEAGFLDAIDEVEEEKREEIVRWVCEVVNDSVERKEDGTRWLGVVRLRVLARKKRAESSHTPNVIRRMFDQGALLPGRMSGKGTSFSFI